MTGQCLESRSWQDGRADQSRKRIASRASRRARFFGRGAGVAVRARQAANPCHTWPMGRPRVAGNMGVTQGVHVRPILVDPCVDLISSADGPVAEDEDIDLAPPRRRAACRVRKLVRGR